MDQQVAARVALKRCARRGCEMTLPLDFEGEFCPTDQAAFELVARWEGSRCEAKGLDGDGPWRCVNASETRKFGRLCLAHYQQMTRTGGTRRVRSKTKTREMHEGWATVLRDAGWVVIAPEQQKEEE